MTRARDVIAERLHLDRAADWRLGARAVLVFTRSGSVYQVDTQGTVRGGSLGTENGRLQGAVYSTGGPLRPGEIVVGLSMEIVTHRNVVTTTRVERVEDAE
ncbi:hypothetical protein K2Z84_05285 [Candidatus Binatia bacterium]|nr:hypothetical protein [Candidatus Binatia bacterium]